MSTGTWTLIAWLCILGFVPVGTYLGWHYGRVEGRHEGRCAEKERELARRHRAELRVPYEGPEIRAKTGSLPLIDTGRMPVKRMTDITRTHVTAPDLVPVIVPEPGLFPPQPGGTGPHTTRIPALTDTGELRALTVQTDAWLEGMRQKGMITWYWPDWNTCSDPPPESCSDAGCPIHGDAEDTEDTDDSRDA